MSTAGLNDWSGESPPAWLGHREQVTRAPRIYPPRGGLAAWQAQRIAGYIREHMGTRLKASDLAAMARLSDSHFSRAFKATFAVPPAVYIMRLRMRVAQEKMLTTGHSLAQIALECGLCDQAHFSRTFRRVVGQTPHHWRRQYMIAPTSGGARTRGERTT